jgi:hypothetical protein
MLHSPRHLRSPWSEILAQISAYDVPRCSNEVASGSKDLQLRQWRECHEFCKYVTRLKCICTFSMCSDSISSPPNSQNLQNIQNYDGRFQLQAWKQLLIKNEEKKNEKYENLSWDTPPVARAVWLSIPPGVGRCHPPRSKAPRSWSSPTPPFHTKWNEWRKKSRKMIQYNRFNSI